MVNGLYDFNTLAPWVSPYVGVGVGYIENSLNQATIYSTQLGSQLSNKFSDSAKGSAAGQFILGAAWPVGVPGLAVTTEFRFLGEFSQQTYQGVTTYKNATIYGSSMKLAAPTNKSFLIGLRYAFNAAPPPPAPMPAPAAAPAPMPARTYLVFFDWDKADLSARAHQIIAEAAQNSTHVQLTKIQVSGYADRTGTAQYNMVLSRKRARTWLPTWSRTACPRISSPSRLLATLTCWFRPPLACASRRTAASRSTCSNRSLRLTDSAAVLRDGGVCLYAARPGWAAWGGTNANGRLAPAIAYRCAVGRLYCFGVALRAAGLAGGGVGAGHSLNFMACGMNWVLVSAKVVRSSGLTGPSTRQTGPGCAGRTGRPASWRAATARWPTG